MPTGAFGRKIEVEDDGLKVIASDGFNTAKAQVLLMLAL